jgi:hypothetical protein
VKGGADVGGYGVSDLREACKALPPITAGNYAFSCIVHHDFEVTKAGMEQKEKKLLGVVRWEAALQKAKK